MFAKSWLARQMNTRTITPTFKRAFSQSYRPPQASNTGLYVLGGLGLAGIVFTCMKGRQISLEQARSASYGLQGQTTMSPLV